MTAARENARTDAPGLPARRLAAQALVAVLQRHLPLDEVFDSNSGLKGIETFTARDRALVRMLVATTLRRLGTLRTLIGSFLDRGLPEDVPLTEAALLIGATQILFLDVPDHAAVDLSVRLVDERHTGLVNAVLRRLAGEGRDRLSRLDPIILDTPPWLFERWQQNYGVETARAIAAQHAIEPPLDLTVKRDAALWAERLGGRVLPTGSVRLVSHGLVAALTGYDGGEWWVQDTAASLPARLLGPVRDLAVADLCAAPGGKTAQLAAAGARLVAVDSSKYRLDRLKTNLARLRLSAQTMFADATKWRANPFDAVLLDVPCSATGTIRRHPDLPWQKRPEDLPPLIELQARLLDHAGTLTRPGGLLLYATCSLEPEESELQIESFLSKRPDFARVPIAPEEVGGVEAFLSAAGDLRTLPCHLPHSDPHMSGCDGFYAARLRRLA